MFFFLKTQTQYSDGKIDKVPLLPYYLESVFSFFFSLFPEIELVHNLWHLSFTHTHTLSFTHTHSLFHTHSLSLFSLFRRHTYKLTHIHIHTLSITWSLSHTHSHTFYHTLSITNSLYHTLHHIRYISHSHSNHKCTDTLTLFCTPEHLFLMKSN